MLRKSTVQKLWEDEVKNHLFRNESELPIFVWGSIGISIWVIWPGKIFKKPDHQNWSTFDVRYLENVKIVFGNPCMWSANKSIIMKKLKIGINYRQDAKNKISVFRPWKGQNGRPKGLIAKEFSVPHLHYFSLLMSLFNGRILGRIFLIHVLLSNTSVVPLLAEKNGFGTTKIAVLAQKATSF